ncbi:MAG: hypothetical protein EON58_05690 [Alphaproteobacteria bacterium]|nr:MAG: hypothetical protein EON58_05690 [Alphaproteobacteria bacterium]
MLEPSFYTDKESRILDLSRQKSVLHLGCIGNTDESTARKIELAHDTLHARLTEVASRVLGIDLDGDAVQLMLESGIFNNIRQGDACRLDEASIGADWDLIVVGDLIEHVSNPGLLLDSIRGVMTAKTLLVFTTPNAFGLPSVVRHALGKFHEGKEHVLSFNYLNLQQLLERHLFKTESIGTCHQSMAERSPFFRIGKGLFEAMPRFGGTLFVTATSNLE